MVSVPFGSALVPRKQIFAVLTLTRPAPMPTQLTVVRPHK